jgi:hypothetical protein
VETNLTDRRIIIAENNRASFRGVAREGDALWVAYQREDDSLTYVLDYSNWLGSETISSVTRVSSGTTVAGTANTTTTVTQRLKGAGYVDVEITTSGSQVKTDRIEIRDRSENVYSTYQ